MPSATSWLTASSATISMLRPSHPRAVALALPIQSWRRLPFAANSSFACRPCGGSFFAFRDFDGGAVLLLDIDSAFRRKIGERLPAKIVEAVKYASVFAQQPLKLKIGRNKRSACFRPSPSACGAHRRYIQERADDKHAFGIRWRLGKTLFSHQAPEGLRA